MRFLRWFCRVFKSFIESLPGFCITCMKFNDFLHGFARAFSEFHGVLVRGICGAAKWLLRRCLKRDLGGGRYWFAGSGSGRASNNGESPAAIATAAAAAASAAGVAAKRLEGC